MFFVKKKAVNQPSSRDRNGSKTIQVSDATTATVEKHLTFTWDIGSSCGFTPLDRLADGCLGGTRKPLEKETDVAVVKGKMSSLFFMFFRLKKSQSVAYKCIRWLICKRILKFWPYDVIWWGRVSWTSLFAKKPCCKDVLGWIRINVVMLLKGIDGVPHEDQMFHIGPVFKDINSCDHKAQRKSRERERERDVSECPPLCTCKGLIYSIFAKVFACIYIYFILALRPMHMGTCPVSSCKDVVRDVAPVSGCVYFDMEVSYIQKPTGLRRAWLGRPQNTCPPLSSLTWLAGKFTTNEDVSLLLKMGNFPMSC